MKMEDRRGVWGEESSFSPRGVGVHYGWVVALVGTLGMMASVPGQTVGVNVFNEWLMAALGLGRVEVSAAYFVGTGVSGLALPFAGVMFDRLGARRLMVAACLGLAVSLGLISSVDTIAGALGGVVGVEALGGWLALRLGVWLYAFF